MDISGKISSTMTSTDTTSSFKCYDHNNFNDSDERGFRQNVVHRNDLRYNKDDALRNCFRFGLTYENSNLDKSNKENRSEINNTMNSGPEFRSTSNFNDTRYKCPSSGVNFDAEHHYKSIDSGRNINYTKDRKRKIAHDDGTSIKRRIKTINKNDLVEKQVNRHNCDKPYEYSICNQKSLNKFVKPNGEEDRDQDFGVHQRSMDLSSEVLDLSLKGYKASEVDVQKGDQYNNGAVPQQNLSILEERQQTAQLQRFGKHLPKFDQYPFMTQSNELKDIQIHSKDMPRPSMFQPNVIGSQMSTPGSAIHISSYTINSTAPQLASSTQHPTLNHNSDQVEMVTKNGVRKSRQGQFRFEYPFLCDYCSRSFTTKKSMRRHVKFQHPQYWARAKQNSAPKCRGSDDSSHIIMSPSNSKELPLQALQILIDQLCHRIHPPLAKKFENDADNANSDTPQLHNDDESRLIIDMDSEIAEEETTRLKKTEISVSTVTEPATSKDFVKASNKEENNKKTTSKYVVFASHCNIFRFMPNKMFT